MGLRPTSSREAALREEKRSGFCKNKEGGSSCWLVSFPQPGTTCRISPWSLHISTSTVHTIASIAQLHGLKEMALQNNPREPKIIPPRKPQPGKSLLLLSFSFATQKNIKNAHTQQRNTRVGVISYAGCMRMVRENIFFQLMQS